MCSTIVALLLFKIGLNARWYNGLLLFPFGMAIAYKEKRLIELIEKRWNVFFVISIILFVISGAAFVYFKQDFAGIHMIKTFSGMCLSILVCVMFLRIRFSRGVMEYIGKRSLYFYLVHINLLSIIGRIENVNVIHAFYIVLILTFIISEIFYQILAGNKKKRELNTA